MTQIILQMWQCDQSISISEVIIMFLRNALSSRSIVWDWTRYGLEILRHCDKRVKTKSQKVLEVNSYVFRSYKGKTGRGANFLISVKALKRLLAVLHKLFMCFVKVSLWSMVISKTFTLLVLFICLFYTMNVMLLILLIFRH